MADEERQTCTVKIAGHPCGQPAIRWWWPDFLVGTKMEAECSAHDSERTPGMTDRRTGKLVRRDPYERT